MELLRLAGADRRERRRRRHRPRLRRPGRGRARAAAADSRLRVVRENLGRDSHYANATFRWNIAGSPPRTRTLRCSHVMNSRSACPPIHSTTTVTCPPPPWFIIRSVSGRSEELTSELQSPDHLVCRLLLEKKNAPYSSAP